MSLNENKSTYIMETLCLCIIFYLAFDIPLSVCVFLYLSFVHLFSYFLHI